MLALEQRSPRLADGQKLLHPADTDVFILYRSTTGERFELNEVAYEMLSCMDGHATVDAICETISSKYADADTVHEDLESLLAELVAEGLVVFVSA